jgi:putative hydrolase of the HAD superfamily
MNKGSPPASASRPAGDGDAPGPLPRLIDAEVWLFDLDNTLYPPQVNLFAEIDERMRGFIAEFLGLPLNEAFALQKRYFREFGTSLRGLMENHGLDPAPFLAHVHDIDITPLTPDPRLDAVLARLPGRKIVFTNASTRHAERVMDRLGIARHFEAVFDIVATGYRPKPEPGAYRQLVERYGFSPRAAVMVEDMARNLRPAAELGMTTVWIRNTTEHGIVDAEGDHIHHTIDELTVWLEAVAAAEVVPRQR